MNDRPIHATSYERLEEEEEEEGEEEEDYDDDNGVASPTAHFVPTVEFDTTDAVNSLRIEYPNQLTVFSAFALMISSQIGTGIFSSPSHVDTHVASPGTAMVVWAIAGLIAWMGAIAFAELGAAIPRNGGMQEYLRYIYGDSLAFIMSWTWIVAVKPAAMAIQCLIFAEYWTSAIFSASTRSIWVDKILAIVSLGVILLVNSVNLSATTRLTNLLVFPKLGTIALVVLLALIVGISVENKDRGGTSNYWRWKDWFAARQVESGEGVQVDWSKVTSWELMGNYAAALYAGLWAYGGWDKVSSCKGVAQF